MAQPARPKREGDDFARSHDNTSKKPRFDYRNPSTLAADEPEDDVVLDADVIGRSGRQVKRNAVNIDGYESDSDDDNAATRAAIKARQKKKEEQSSKDEDDADMFADLDEGMQGTADGDEDEDLAPEGKLKAKTVKFIDNRQIEGQVMNSTSGGRVSSNFQPVAEDQQEEDEPESDKESSSGDEEERDQLPGEMEDDLAAEIGAGGKKRNAPRLDAFNLKAEEEEGRFDESMNFVRKAVDPDANNDNWLEGLNKKDMKKAKEAQERREQDQRRKALEDDAVLTSDLLSTLIQYLETGETPLEALQRLNKGKSNEAKIPLWKQKKMREANGADGTAESSAATPAETARKQAVAAITGAADRLYTRGQHEIYDVERELLRRQYRRETGEDWQPPAANNQADGAAGSWEYRWSDARDGGQKHGPYDAAMMKAWNDAGYFGEGVEFKRTDHTEWSRVLEIGE
jgi:CD2 antigen cytoplasmic tail-binding protein 2